MCFESGTSHNGKVLIVWISVDVISWRHSPCTVQVILYVRSTHLLLKPIVYLRWVRFDSNE